jgi:hypothetical protein
MTTVWIIMHDDMSNFREDGCTYLRAAYASRQAALDDLPNTLSTDADEGHWSPGPHTADCCEVVEAPVFAAPVGGPYRLDWWKAK